MHDATTSFRVIRPDVAQLWIDRQIPADGYGYFTTSVAVAQAAGVRVAVVNPARVFNEIEETKALQTRNNDEQKKIELASKEKAAAMSKLKTERDNSYKPDSQQFEDATLELARLTADYKVWAEFEKAKAEHNQKKQTKQLFDKIQVAISDVAKRDGVDIVISDTSERLPDDIDSMDVRALRAMILQKNVLFVSAKQGLDMTDAVILMLNAKAKAAGGPAPAPLVNPVPPK